MIHHGETSNATIHAKNLANDKPIVTFEHAEACGGNTHEEETVATVDLRRSAGFPSCRRRFTSSRGPLRARTLGSFPRGPGPFLLRLRILCSQAYSCCCAGYPRATTARQASPLCPRRPSCHRFIRPLRPPPTCKSSPPLPPNTRRKQTCPTRGSSPRGKRSTSSAW